MAIIVNLLGTPGAGKSTGCAYIFSKLKLAGINAELITEFAKDKVWEDNQAALSNQLYIFGKQNYKISRCEKKVDVIITDSPLLNSILYNKDKVLGEEFNALVAKVFKSYSNMTYLINRTKPYNPAGRLQTESQADALKSSILSILTRYDIPYRERNGDQQSYEQIANDVFLTVKHLKAIRAQNNFSTTKEFKPQDRIMNFDWFQEKMQKIPLKNLKKTMKLLFHIKF